MTRFERSSGIALVVAASLAVAGCIGTRSAGPGVRSPSPGAAPSELAETGSPLPSPSPSAADPAPTASDEMTGTAGPGCGTGQMGFFAHHDEIKLVLTLEGAPIELTPAAVGLLNGTYDADDVIPGYVGLSKDELAVKDVPAGKLLLVGKGMTLTGLTVGTVPWSTLDFSADLPSTTATPKALTWRPVSKGRIVIIAPSRRGDYMLDMRVLWQTGCLHGDGTVYGRIDIR